MANGMPEWDEWHTLSKDAQDYKLYEVLTVLTKHLQTTCPMRVEACSEHFQKLERRKWFDRVIAVGVGIGTGIATALGIKVGS